MSRINPPIGAAALALVACGCASKGPMHDFNQFYFPDPEIEYVGRGYTGIHGVADWGKEVAVANSFGKPPGIGVVSGAESSPRPIVETGFGTPAGMLALADGRLLVCDANLGKIVLLSPDGTVLSTTDSPAPWNIARVDWGDGAESFAVVHFAGELSVLSVVDGQLRTAPLLGKVGEYPFGIAWHPKKRMLLVTLQQEGKVISISFPPPNAKGEVSSTVFLAGLSNPEGIAVDEVGNVWVAETAAHRVSAYSSGGALRGRTPDGALRFPVSISPSRDGTVLVGCGGDSGKVYRLSWN